MRYLHKSKFPLSLFSALLMLAASATGAIAAGVKPGDTITKDNAAQVQDLLSPGNLILVQRGMQIHVIPTDKLEWPPPYKSASEKYASQVTLGTDGEIKGYRRRAAVSVARSE